MKSSLIKIKKSLNKNKIAVSVIGMGYVGLPLAVLIGKKFETFGIDKSNKKITMLKKRVDQNDQITKKDFSKSKKISFFNNYSTVAKSQIIIVCLPTPVNSKKLPDLKILKYASKEIGKNITKGSIVVYESTVYPGVIENICAPIIQKHSKLKWKEDFFLGYSPERVNPNDNLHTIDKINKLVSGDSDIVAEILKTFYKKIISSKIIKVESIKIAETAKVLENTQRDLNIALMNELSIICNKLNIKTKDVIDAASTKWNFMKFEPGLVGGHCIGVDPYYLKKISIDLGYFPKIISSGRNVNDNMVNYVIKKIVKQISKKDKLLFLGCSFKENCNDIRNSKNLELVTWFKKNNYKFDLYDPIVDIKK